MRLSGRRAVIFGQPWIRRQRVALVSLMGFNAVAFVLQIFLENWEPGFTREFLGLSDRGVHDAYSWQFVTAMFLHTGPFQLLANMLALYFLGRDVESIIGQRHFTYLYIAGVVTGECFHLFSMPIDTVLFAASGGVAALVVANATILPELELISTTFLGLPVRFKARHLAYMTAAGAIIAMFLVRQGTVANTGYVGGCAAGWVYAHLLGFGRTSWLQRRLQQRRISAERFRQLSPAQLMAEEIDPLLDKISKHGMKSLSRAERTRLARARERILVL